MFCWLSFEQTLAAVIEGFEQAWAFLSGVFRVVIPDGIRAIVIESDPVAPRFNAAFLEYAQARGFMLDPARGRRPDDKPRHLRSDGPLHPVAWSALFAEAVVGAHRRIFARSHRVPTIGARRGPEATAGRALARGVPLKAWTL